MRLCAMNSSDEHLFAQIAITLISESLYGEANNEHDHSGMNHGCLDFEMVFASEVLKRCGGGAAVDKNVEKQNRLTIMLKVAFD